MTELFWHNTNTMLKTIRKKYIGDRTFYKKLLTIMLPVLAQNVVTNFVSLLDNIMVGRIGTEQMSGVAIVNQLLFIFNLALFGGLSGAGIFTAQYFGKGDENGVRDTMRAKGWLAGVITIVFVLLYTVFGKEFISLFIHKGEDDIDLAMTLTYGLDYLKVIMFQMPLFAAINVYATSLRETGETRVPLVASLSAVGVNLFFNWVLIFGKLGSPALGVVGAAIATVIARIVELIILLIKAHRSCFRGVWGALTVPKSLMKNIVVKAMPLMANEILWSSGMTTLIQIMSRMGVEVVSAENISNTISNLFFCSYFAAGSAISIIIGQLLGAGELEKAVDEDRKILAFSVTLSTFLAIIMILIAPLLPEIYNTTAVVKSLASSFIIINAVMMPFNSFIHRCYFTMRSGGKVLITFIYDSAYLWIISIPITAALVKYSSLAIVSIYAISYYLDLIKAVFGYVLVKKKTWVNNLVREN